MQVRHAGSKTAVLLMMLLFSTASAGAQQPVTGYAPVNGLEMYYEIHGQGEPVVLLHGSFMTIPGNWTEMIAALSKTRQVIAVEMQGHGRTADIDRDFSYDNLSDDIAALLDYLKIGKADIVGYSMGAGVGLNMAIRHPGNVRKVVSISGVFRDTGWVQEALDAYPHFTADAFKGSPIEAQYKRLSPTPNEFPNFVKRAISMDLKHYDFGAGKLQATPAPIFFIHGDADGVRLEHIAEMYRLKSGEIMGDMRPRSASRLAVLPDTTHVTLMQKIDVIAPMITDFLDSKPTTSVPH
jgi:pimeloyl-ACP methyl ester carboxylesterase